MGARRRVAVLLLFGMACAVPGNAFAEAYFAVREGYHCNQCHVNRTGGGKRNRFGVNYAQTSLPIWTLGGGSDDDSDWFVSTELNDYFSLGANLRMDGHWKQPQDPCWRREEATRWKCGPEIPTNVVPPDPAVAESVEGQKGNFAFEFSEANLYFEGRLLGDHLTFYVDLNMRGGIREALIIAQDLLGPAHLYVKVGEMFLPYGIRLLDDTAFVRQPTGANYTIRERGIEVGVEPGPFVVSLAYTNGVESQYPNKLSLMAAGVLPIGDLGSARLGVSGSYAHFPIELAPDKTRNFQTIRAGGFVGLNIGRFTLMGEYDFILDKPGPFTNAAGNLMKLEQHVLFAELDFVVLKGLNLKVAFDYWDPDLNVANNERSRLVFGASVFIVQFLEASVFYRLAMDIPQEVAGNVDELLIQVHAFF